MVLEKIGEWLLIILVAMTLGQLLAPLVEALMRM